MMPSEYSARISSSMRAHLPNCPSYEAREDSLKRLRKPVAFSATIVMCVYAPEPETSSLFWFFSPHRTRFLLNRDSGAT